jgi:hypothetical protein
MIWFLITKEEKTFNSRFMKDGKTRIRLERQEYPNKSVADAVTDKLSSS